MPNRCTVFGCNNTPNKREGIALHQIPFWGDNRPEAKARRKRWIAFIKQKRVWDDQELSEREQETSFVCSRHFQREDFNQLFFILPGQSKPTVPRLKRDEIGILPYPTIQSIDIDRKEAEDLSDRSRRRVSKLFDS